MSRAIATLLAAAMLAGLLALYGGPARAQQFSADVVHTNSSGGSDGHASKLYVSDDKLRMDNAGPEGGFLLIDRKARTAHTVVPAAKAYLDMPQSSLMAQLFMPVIDPNDACRQWQQMMQSAAREPGEWRCRRIGPETVNGRATVKYEGTSPKGETGYGWVDPRLKFLVKRQDAHGNGMELRDIKEGPQQASLFEIPADYQKTDMRELMQRMMQQRGGPKP